MEIGVDFLFLGHETSFAKSFRTMENGGGHELGESALNAESCIEI